MKNNFYVNPDIQLAETLPSSFYSDPDVFDILKERVFVSSWQWIGDEALVPLDSSTYPFFFMEHYIDEPMVLVRENNGQIICLSNVCTHRGNLVVQHPGTNRQLQCMYHGRRFDLSGQFKFMPEFKSAQNFPRSCENLRAFSLHRWSQFLFTSMEPSFEISSVINEINKRTYFLPLHEFKHSPERSKDYIVNAHWALYCDNYLEGFHIPFVHNDLNEALDYGQYATEIYDYCNLQIGFTSDSTNTFELPEEHPDHGRNVGAYYYWIYPNIMFNFYPWGLSINIVKPQSMNRTRVSFMTYVYDESLIESGAGAAIDKVEREDEFVVESVQKGIKSRTYKTGRFSPNREKGVHQFHLLLSQMV